MAEQHNIIGVISRMDSGKLRVHPERCVHVRHKNADCLRCAAVCTTGAISLGNAGIQVDPTLCIGCGACASVCPTACLEPLNPTDDQLDAALQAAVIADQGRVTIACEQALDAGRAMAGADDVTADGTPVVGVVCLGRAEESALVEAAARGASRILLLHADCAACPHARGGELSEQLCASARDLLACVGATCTIERADAGSVRWQPAAADTPDVVYSAIAQAGATAAQARTNADATQAAAIPPAFVHVQKDGTLPHLIPPRRLRLYNSLKRLGSPVRGTLTTRLWGQVTINTDLCRSCRMCTVFCPTGALSRFDTAAGGFGVEHRSTLCVQCRLCEAICPEGAITVSDTVSLPEFFSGKKYRFEMQPVGWKPNASDAIATRVSRFVNVDALQDPEARLKPEEMVKMRHYNLDRDAKRAQIRAGQTVEAADAQPAHV